MAIPGFASDAGATNSPTPVLPIQTDPTTAQKGARPVKQRELIKASPVEPCETCGTPVRASLYQGGKPRLNEVANGRDLPGGHTPQTCQERRTR